MTPFGITWTKVESALLPSYLLLCHVVLYIYKLKKTLNELFVCKGPDSSHHTFKSYKLVVLQYLVSSIRNHVSVFYCCGWFSLFLQERIRCMLSPFQKKKKRRRFVLQSSYRVGHALYLSGNNSKHSDQEGENNEET